MADKRITEAQFSMQCSFIAKNAAAWAGDLLTLPERYNSEADTNTVARFTDELRGRLDRLDARAGRDQAPLQGWPIETDDQVEALARECKWDNRKYMTPADYSIWCDRMRDFARLAATRKGAGHAFGTASIAVRRDGSIVMSFGDPSRGRHEQFDFEGSRELAEFIVSIANAASDTKGISE